MLTLLLAMALMAIFAAAIVPSITFDIKRDREEEMIHRGVQYSRAIRAYYKKFGRYPTKIEDLESTNTMRFLRKRYKDPLNCKERKCADFKLLHFGEVQMTLSAMGGGAIPGANPIGANAAGPTRLFANLPHSAATAFGLTNSNSTFGQNHARPLRDRIRRSRDRKLSATEPTQRIRQDRGAAPAATRSAPAKSSAARSSESPAPAPSRTRPSANSITRRNIRTGCLFTIRRRIRDA